MGIDYHSGRSFAHGTEYRLIDGWQPLSIAGVAYVQGDPALGTALLAVSDTLIITAYVPPDTLDVDGVLLWMRTEMPGALAEFNRRVATDGQPA